MFIKTVLALLYGLYKYIIVPLVILFFVLKYNAFIQMWLLVILSID
jgi:hypothetical protein